MLDLSIIIVNYNTKKLVLDCIKSIKQSKPTISWEIIIVDNGSRDDSIDVLKNIESKKVKVLLNKKNLGFAKANNRGIRNSRGKHILLLNSDTLVKKEALDELFAFAENNEDAGVVGSRLLNIDNTVQGSVMNFPTIINAVKEYWLGKKGYFGLFVPKTNKPTQVDAVVGATFLITQEARKRVGLLDEKYFMYFEDLDYCRRVWETGLKVYYLPDSKIAHYHGVSGKDIVKPEFQWNRLVPSSKIYHGLIKHYLIVFVMWSGQKFRD